MSDEINPTLEESPTTDEMTAVAQEPIRPPTILSQTVSLRDGMLPPFAADADDDEEGSEFDAEEADEEQDLYVEGPANYVERERGGRSRGIGTDVKLDDIDYKNIPMLSRFLDRRGRILARRKTRVSAKVQRRIVRAIKRARHLALLPYTSDQSRIVRKRR